MHYKKGGGRDQFNILTMYTTLSLPVPTEREIEVQNQWVSLFYEE